MKERPIIFSGESVRAILDGHKTQTRRVMKPQPSEEWHPHDYGEVHKMFGGEFIMRGRYEDEPVVVGWGPCNDDGSEAHRSPYGQPGDRLWVREVAAWNPEFREPEDIWYRADPKWDEPGSGYYPDTKSWRSPIHMPKWASRITLEVTGVRVERLQAITVNDVVAEGIDLEGEHADDFLDAGHAQAGGLSIPCDHPEISPFVRLWDSINGRKPGHAWADNPFVWVIEFKQVAP